MVTGVLDRFHDDYHLFKFLQVMMHKDNDLTLDNESQTSIGFTLEIYDHTPRFRGVHLIAKYTYIGLFITADSHGYHPPFNKHFLLEIDPYDIAGYMIGTLEKSIEAINHDPSLIDTTFTRNIDL